MRPLPNDYDSDPSRFLSTGKHPHDDVHPHVAARFAAAGVRTVLDVGGGNGRLARLLPGWSMRVLLADMSPTMLALAPRPSVRADGARLPVGDASVDAVAALYTLYHYADPLVPIAEAQQIGQVGVAAGELTDFECARFLREMAAQIRFEFGEIKFFAGSNRRWMVQQVAHSQSP